MRTLPVLIYCALTLACASQKSSESHADYSKEVTRKVEKSPERITTTVREYGPPSPSGSGTRPKAVDELGGISKLAPGGLSAAPSPDVPTYLPEHGPLIKETVTVDERGPITVQTGSEVTAHADAKSKSSWKFGLTLWPYLLGAALLGAVGFVLWKLKPPWLGWVFKLLGR